MKEKARYYGQAHADKIYPKNNKSVGLVFEDKQEVVSFIKALKDAVESASANNKIQVTAHETGQITVLEPIRKTDRKRREERRNALAKNFFGA